MEALRIKRGNPFQALMTLTGIDDQPMNLTEATVIFTVRSLTDHALTDAAALIRKVITTHHSPGTGQTYLDLTSAQTTMSAGTYIGDIRIVGSELKANTDPFLVEIEPVVTTRTIEESVLWGLYWNTLISATVEDAEPTHVVLTFPEPEELTVSDFLIEGFPISTAFWTGPVLTLVLTEAVEFGDVLPLTFVPSGDTINVTNNIEIDWSAYWTPLFTGVPLPSNMVNQPDINFRSIVYDGTTYHFFEEIFTGGIWYNKKRTSTDKLTFSAASASLLAVGGAGAFDEKGQADPTVIRESATDWKMWFDALNGADLWDKLGYATSTDGTTWVKVGSVIERGVAGSWDDYFIHHPAVIKYNGVYYMFYAGAKSTSAANYKIGLATSVNGINWTKEATNPVLTIGAGGDFDDLYIRPSCPILIYGTWYMWYWATKTGPTYALGLATSPDLITWTKQGKVYDLPTGSMPVVISGTRGEDKFIQIWHNSGATGLRLIGASLPLIGTRLASFTNYRDNTKYGDYVLGASDAAHASNYIYLHRITVGGNITPTAIKINIKKVAMPSGGAFKLALYANGVNTPTDLLAVTEEKTYLQVRYGEWNVFSFVVPPVLTAADYWIGVWSDANYGIAKGAGGANNHGNLSLAYGAFPDPIIATTNEAYTDIDMYLSEGAVDTSIWNTRITPEPAHVYFNTVVGNKVATIAEVNSEYDWCWVDDVVYVYSPEHPDFRYHISYD